MKHSFRYALLALVVPMVCTSAQAQQVTRQALKLVEAERLISNLYVDKVDENKLVVDGIQGMLQKLDPHSEYLTPEEVKQMNEPLQGNFDGIGVSFQIFQDTLVVMSTVSGGPSEKVGIMAGDRIVAVNDSAIAGVKMSNQDIMKRLRGKKGTLVQVRILRRGVTAPLNFKIIRDKIPIYSLDASYMVQPGIGYIRLNRFAATSYQEVKEAMDKLIARGMKSLIFDLQGNGGGYMNVAVQIVNEFLEANKLIVYTQGNSQPRQDERSRFNGSFREGELIVLIDETSASASEIVSGAIQDWDRGTIVGRRSFGKGLVQRPFMLSDQSMLKLTTARYYTPSGRYIQKPYEGGSDTYDKDLIDRFNRGELQHADSIHFPDSLRYKTLVKGRTVYGGGGIMPDIFVPLDTTKFTDFHREIVSKGVVNRVVLTYMEKERANLKRFYHREEDFVKRFELNNAFYEGLIEEARKENIKVNEEQARLSKSYILLQMKALIGRDLFETGTFYRIINENNDIFQRALQLLQSKK